MAPAKGGVERELTVVDRRSAPVVRALLDRRVGAERLLAYWRRPAWCEVRTVDVNDYLREVSGCDMTAKDFRTWHANVVAASALAAAGPPPRSPSRQRRVVAGAMRTVAEVLGNTPTVARSSYVDPQLLDLYGRGELDVLTPAVNGRAHPSPAVERMLVRLLRDAGT